MENPQFLDNLYRKLYIKSAIEKLPDGLVLDVNTPFSQTCPDLAHISPSDFTLVSMQAAYMAVKQAVPDVPDNFTHAALFLGHKAEYSNQVITDSLRLTCTVKVARRGEFGLANVKLVAPGSLSKELTVGLVKDMPQAAIEDIMPNGQNLSKDFIDEVLNIYKGERQADVVGVGYDRDSNAHEVSVNFPQYSEIRDLRHVSAKQMIEAMMKAAYCAVANEAYSGNLSISYREFLDNRLNFRTKEHDIKYRKFLGFGTCSLLRIRLSFKDNTCTANFENRPGAEDKEKSFATGRMTFYLPGFKTTKSSRGYHEAVLRDADRKIENNNLAI